MTKSNTPYTITLHLFDYLGWAFVINQGWFMYFSKKEMNWNPRKEVLCLFVLVCNALHMQSKQKRFRAKDQAVDGVGPLPTLNEYLSSIALLLLAMWQLWEFPGVGDLVILIFACWISWTTYRDGNQVIDSTK